MNVSSCVPGSLVFDEKFLLYEHSFWIIQTQFCDRSIGFLNICFQRQWELTSDRIAPPLDGGGAPQPYVNRSNGIGRSCRDVGKVNTSSVGVVLNFSKAQPPHKDTKSNYSPNPLLLLLPLVQFDIDGRYVG
jgi:hypothetical protein